MVGRVTSEACRRLPFSPHPLAALGHQGVVPFISLGAFCLEPRTEKLFANFGGFSISVNHQKLNTFRRGGFREAIKPQMVFCSPLKATEFPISGDREAWLDQKLRALFQDIDVTGLKEAASGRPLRPSRIARLADSRKRKATEDVGQTRRTATGFCVARLNHSKVVVG